MPTLERRQARRDYFFLRQPGCAHVAVHLAPNARQGLPESQQVLILVRIAQCRPARVVPVLLAAPRVAAGGLEVPMGQGTDPDVFIGGRNDQRVDAGDLRVIFDAFSLRVHTSATGSGGDMRASMLISNGVGAPVASNVPAGDVTRATTGPGTALAEAIGSNNISEPIVAGRGQPPVPARIPTGECHATHLTATRAAQARSDPAWIAARGSAGRT
ncbi:hypothetical protein G6F22_016029 [Rhizopus arrhizus]|nr:hypothetical protein G6F22_016029 [Rhizopus arrhizus]